MTTKKNTLAGICLLLEMGPTVAKTAGWGRCNNCRPASETTDNMGLVRWGGGGEDIKAVKTSWTQK